MNTYVSFKHHPICSYSIHNVNKHKSKCHYNVKIVTKTKPNSGISFPNSGVHLLLMNYEDKFSLHHIPRVDCNNEVRFETGSVNTVQIVSNNEDLGDLRNVWICPEEGTWNLDRVIICNESYDTVQTFPCDEIIGDDKNPAIILDENTTTNVSSFDENKHSVGINDYHILKKDLLLCNVYLVMIGTLTLAYNPELSKSFLEGGVVGTLYLFLLEKQTDHFGSQDTNAFLIPFMYGPVRLIIIAYLSVSSSIFKHPDLLLPYTVGFFMYKLSVLIVGLR